MGALAGATEGQDRLIRPGSRGRIVRGGGLRRVAGDTSDIEAATLLCTPGLAGTVETCRASN